ncbi:Hypothetical protein D9617_16g015490 [Elsinoe fawcettii]|nr:Hypothetical protein D9617_16g015490 [Elsinoe fawcettii]
MTTATEFDTLDETRSIASAMLPSYEQDVYQAPPGYQPARRVPSDLRALNEAKSITLLSKDGQARSLVFKKAYPRPSTFLHNGSDGADPIIASSKMTTWPVQERICLADHEKTAEPDWIELVRSGDFATCAFSLPPELGGRHLVWHFGDPKKKYSGSWVLSSHSDADRDTSRVLCSFERALQPHQGIGVLEWKGEVSYEEEVTSILVLFICHRRLKDDGRLGSHGLAGVVEVAAGVAFGLLG